MRPPLTYTYDTEPIFYETKDSGERVEFANGGRRDTEKGKPRFDLLLPKTVPYADQMLTRVAELLSRGAQKYSDRNWELFNDPASLARAKSGEFRHSMQWQNNETDEDHAAAIIFNVIAAEYIKGVLDGRWPPLSAEDELGAIPSQQDEEDAAVMDLWGD